MDNSRSKRICHYTDMNALHSILQSNEIVLRASNILYLNDKKEAREGLRVMKKIWQGVVNQMPQSQTTELIQELRKIDYKLFNNFYVTSFCEYKDDLTMWRMYADDCRGCALEFDRTQLEYEYNEQPNRLFLECIYGEKNANTKYKPNVEKLFNNIVLAEQLQDAEEGRRNFQEFANGFIIACIQTKHKAFEAEKESRGACLYVKGNGMEIKFRVKNNYIVPYIEIGIPKKALKKVILGPNTSQISLESVSHLLQINEYKGVGVKKSSLPYRG